MPTGLRVFLAALAIADDLGAVLVIALFYTTAISWTALAGVGVVLVALLALNRAGARKPLTYALLGVGLWVLMLKSGVHATIAGVLLALTIPARTRIDETEFLAAAEASLADFRAADEPGTTVLTNQGHQEALHQLERVADLAQAPLQRMEHALNGVVAFAGAADLPTGVMWRHVHGASWLAGIGFTMSLFVAGLAFGDVALLDTAKIGVLGVLGGSVIAGIVGYLLLRTTPASRAADSTT